MVFGEVRKDIDNLREIVRIHTRTLKRILKWIEIQDEKK